MLFACVNLLIPRSITFSYVKSLGMEGYSDAAIQTPIDNMITAIPSRFQIKTSSNSNGANITVNIILQQAVELMINTLPKPIDAIHKMPNCEIWKINKIYLPPLRQHPAAYIKTPIRYLSLSLKSPDLDLLIMPNFITIRPSDPKKDPDIERIRAITFYYTVCNIFFLLY